MKIVLFILFTLAVFAPTKDVEWKMYPNPAKDHITIEIKDGDFAKYVNIYNMNGILVQKEFIKGQSVIRVELHLRPGSYIVKLEEK
jgi:hypothetical protein